MSGIGITGKWAGTYTMGESYSGRLRGVSVPFTLIIEEKNNVIKGYCVDEGYADLDNPATIEGLREEQYIDFVKKYPYRWYSKQDGTIVYCRDQPSQEVHYKGTFRNNVFAGEWKIISLRVLEDGSVVERVSSGHWIMHKVDL